MSASERRKGLKGEREVADMLRAHGFTVRGLESGGDWLAIPAKAELSSLSVESKWQNVARPWLWQEQALRDRVPGTLPLVAFRRDRTPWWGMSPLDELLEALAR